MSNKLYTPISTTKATEGKKISAEMINGYTSLLENVENSTKKIEEILVSSKEQQSGITQINDAINQLDEQTQQNASVANETKSIAYQTQSLADEIVKDANEKEFEGKNSVKERDDIDTKDIKKISKEENIPKPKKEIDKDKEKNKVVKPNNDKKDDSDEWESF